jgi:hypothetical protein
MIDSTTELLTLGPTTRLLQRSPTRVRAYVGAGRLRAITASGGLRLFDPQEVRRFKATLAAQAKARRKRTRRTVVGDGGALKQNGGREQPRAAGQSGERRRCPTLSRPGRASSSSSGTMRDAHSSGR